MKTNIPLQLQVLIALLRFPVMIFLQVARDIVTAMTGNANYATPFPALAVITAALDDLQAKITAAAGRDRMAIAERNTAWQQSKSLIRQLANYVEMHCQNDLDILLSSGFTATKVATPVGPLAAPVNLQYRYTGQTGEVELRMNAVYGVRGGYPIERSEEDTDIWVPVLTSTKTRLVIGNFTRGKNYRLRAAAIGAAGQSPWSNPVDFLAV
jgi:hypothetical protein